MRKQHCFYTPSSISPFCLSYGFSCWDETCHDQKETWKDRVVWVVAVLLCFWLTSQYHCLSLKEVRKGTQMGKVPGGLEEAADAEAMEG